MLLNPFRGQSKELRLASFIVLVLSIEHPTFKNTAITKSKAPRLFPGTIMQRSQSV